jgi:hypothetical protein
MAMATRTIICGAMSAALWSTHAYAYRPFDGTDANVADTGELEVEFGYLGYLREGEQKSVIAPAMIMNVGLEKESELVLEGKVKTFLNDQSDTRRTVLDDVALSFKQIHRNGVLQNMAGPSVASECGVLLPSLHGHRSGATCAAIVSQRWNSATVHVNAALSRNRESNWERFLGTIVEGPGIGGVRPVLEIFTDRVSTGSRTNSALVGFIWQPNDALAFDFGLRKARTDEQKVTEIRAGLTWSLPVNHTR